MTDSLYPSEWTTTWKMAAFKIGEELAPTGPNGYYDMKPEEWYNWASCQIAKSAPTDDRGVLPMIISETGGDDEPERERIICSEISGGADYINNMPRSLVLERITLEGSIFAHYDQTDSTRPVTDDDLDLLVIAIQALTPHQPDASTHNLAAVDRGREILRNAFARWGRPAPAPAGERQAAPVASVASERGMGLNEYLQMASQYVSALAGELLTLIVAGQITGSDAVITAMAIGRLQVAGDALDYVELPEGGMADQQDGSSQTGAIGNNTPPHQSQ